jgi:GNAT superfamily N-acetyltransferase
VEVRSLDGRNQAWADALVADHFGSARVVSRGHLHQTTDLPCLTAYDSGAPVGLLHYRLDDAGDIEVVTLIAVRPQHGVGTALLDALVEQARAARCRRVWLVTTNDNTPAQDFYLSRGWKLGAVHSGAVTAARALKPEIPLLGEDGAAIEDELEYELVLRA